MFTGIIEEIGIVKSIKNKHRGKSLEITCKKVLVNTKVGDSISVNGICLTVASFSNNAFISDVMPETLRVSNIKRLSIGEAVNLERAAKIGDRIGGHIVSGHVDGEAIKVKQQRMDNAYILGYKAEKEICKYLIPKGSITIDGASLTILSVSKNYFEVSIIPTTSRDTTLVTMPLHSYVNIECDMLAKYVEKFTTNNQDKITLEFLAKNNFL